MRIVNRRYIKLSLIGLATLAAVIALIMTAHGVFYQNKIYPGVHIRNLDVGGLTLSDAADRADKAFTPKGDIDLTYKKKKWPIDLDEIGVKAQGADSAKLAFAVGRNGGFFENLTVRVSAWLNEKSVPIKWKIDNDKTTAVLKKFAKVINQPPVSARLILNLDKVSIEPDQEGRKLSYKNTLARLKKQIDDKTKKIELAVKVTRPEKTTEDIKKLHVEKKVAEYSTSISPAKTGRRANIELALNKLDYTYVPPGETFSFNKVVGPRTRKAGFKDAPVIERGQLVMGIGGGICQVATTIYNAAMIAGMPIVDRSVHSNYISHYPAGRDATVVDGVVDFKFKNDTDGTLVIRTQAISTAVIFRIYGADTGRVNTFSDPETLSVTPYGTKTETDTSLPPGTKVRDQAGVDGRVIKVVRKVTLKGKTLINDTIMSRYSPREEIIKVGPEPPPESTDASATPASSDTTPTP